MAAYSHIYFGCEPAYISVKDKLHIALMPTFFTLLVITTRMMAPFTYPGGAPGNEVWRGGLSSQFLHTVIYAVGE